jgi:hypothetical protein
VDSLKTEDDFVWFSSSFQLAKRMRAKTIIDMYKHPDEHPSRISGVNLKTYYQQAITENSKRDRDGGVE